MSEPLFVPAPFDAVAGTSLQGEIDISYRDLVAVFGKPHTKGDGSKVDAEWILQFNTPGVDIIATIYNYKDGKNYLGRDGLPVSKIREWHIGGVSTHSAYLVKLALLPLLTRDRT
jgi:hypothetical protein